MSLIRISRGIPKFNIQIGPQKDAPKYNPTAILSVTDDFDWSLMQYPLFKWLPINEISKSWGYLPFYATKKILDFWCLEMRYPLVYLCCSAGKHRSPMIGFCWLLSHLSQTNYQLEDIANGFFGDFKSDNRTIDQTYRNDIEKGYLYERITYSENKSVIF